MPDITTRAIDNIPLRALDYPLLCRLLLAEVNLLALRALIARNIKIKSELPAEHSYINRRIRRRGRSYRYKD
jgi:hypothetical protein